MTRRRLTLSLLLFFLALALPTSILVYQAYGQLKWEAFYQHQRLARELSLRIDAGFRELIEREEQRPISDYEFLNVTGSEQSAFLQRSPLSQFPPATGMPGLLGYFQVDQSGQLRTPLLPEPGAETYGIGLEELAQRAGQAERMRLILSENRLVQAPAEGKLQMMLEAPVAEESVEVDTEFEEDAANDSPLLSSATIQADSAPLSESGLGESAQSGFDSLSSRVQKSADAERSSRGQVKDLQLEDNFQVAESAADMPEPEVLAEEEISSRRLRKEKVILPRSVPSESDSGESALDDVQPSSIGPNRLAQQQLRIQTFESEVEPMEFALLDSGHFVLFRRVWHRDQRYVQGVLIEQSGFIDGLIAPAFRESSLSSMSKLIVAYEGDILQQYAAEYQRSYRPVSEQASKELLYQNRLIAPFADIELIFTLARLPVGAGGKVIIWSAIVLTLVLIGGCLMLYRLGQRQLALARQQQDFVSAVSHELKTPLTSIRMYGEMLREGWADEERRKSYYDFIYHEAERLTRLINNVLQLARMSRNEQPTSMAPESVQDLLAELGPRLRSQLEPSGFELAVDVVEPVGSQVIRVDPDGFIQIFINLVDNAVKFSASAEQRRVDIGCRQLHDGRVQFSVRDYGPGIEADQMKKIFTLFYRSENELTRETVGTGIGLALVQQLASAMQAEVDIVNANPGAEFRLRFPAD